MAKTDPAKPTKPLIPPEEALSASLFAALRVAAGAATSLFLHGLVIGLLAMGGLAFFFAPNLEATKPPRMDVVMIEGNGTGFEGLSGRRKVRRVRPTLAAKLNRWGPQLISNRKRANARRCGFQSTPHARFAPRR